jgi:D-alanyl-D-alanine carboxypeptidase/D-alanyl-D-alanine-endopeptidase (penicillin-binding protein 4)
MRKYWIFIYVCFAFLSQSCTRTNWHRAFTHSSLSALASGIYIEELESKKVVFEHHSDHFFMPASNTKLLTFLMANRYLPSTIPNFKYQETPDSLFVWGVGDPSFLDPRFQNKALLDFMQAIKKTVILADADGQIPAFGSGWAWDDYNDDYSAEISSLPIYGNLVRLATKKGNWVFSPGRFKNSAQVNGAYKQVQRERLSNQFSLPLLGAGKSWTQQVPFLTSSKLSADLLADTLGRPVFAFPKALSPQVKTYYSGALDSLFVPLLHESDNLIAEQLLVMMGFEKSWGRSAPEVIKSLSNLPENAWLKEIKWVDGSGLSRYNLVRPKDLAMVMRKLTEEVPFERLTKLLPESGKSGTMKNINLGNSGAKFWAKSGSFGNTYDLSGIYQNAQGKKFLFSVMTNLANQPVSVSKKALIEFLGTLDKSHTK